MKVLMDVPHVEQKYSWDCGVSSVAMVLSSSNRTYLNENLKGVAKEEGFLNSTWTIDLCYLLSRFKVPHQFFTKTLGVHPKYSKQRFYKNTLIKDENRVQDRFANAQASGIDVQKKSVNLQDILKHLENNLPVIALVNSWQLNCKNCFSSTVPVLVKSVLSKTCSYQGHYVVLCGYDSLFKEIYYRNPSRKNKVCVACFESFEESRKCFGTDEDLIFIMENSYQQ